MRKPNVGEYRLSFVFLISVLLFALALSGAVKHAVLVADSFAREKKNIFAKQVFLKTNLKAKSVYIYDETDKSVIFSTHENETLPLASLAKVMTALVVSTDIPNNSKITISNDAIKAEGESGLRSGESWDSSQLTRLMLLSSSNDAASALKEYYEKSNGQGSFIKRMNTLASEIGMTHSIFYSESGLDKGLQPGAIGTGEDVSKMFERALEVASETLSGTATSSTVFRSIDGAEHDAENTNDLSIHIEGLIASKTGYTNLAGGNLGVIFRVPVYGHTVIAVVLGSSMEGRFSDMKMLIDAVGEYFKIRQID